MFECVCVCVYVHFVSSSFNTQTLRTFILQIAHVIREIRHFQQTPYKIDHIPKVTSYLLDTSLLLDDDEMYTRSLQIEPRSSRLSAPSIHNLTKHERKTLSSAAAAAVAAAAAAAAASSSSTND